MEVSIWVYPGTAAWSQCDAANVTYPSRGSPHRQEALMEYPPTPRTQKWRATAQVPVARRDGADRSPWHWLLAVAVVVPLLTPFYNRIEPTLAGIPFFYWFQLALIGLDVGVVTLVYQVTRRRGRP
jgi:hypothetical protein